MIQGEFSHSEGSKSVGFSHGDFSFVVEALYHPAGNDLSGREVIENEVAMRAEHSSDLLQGLDARAHSLTAPFIEEFAGPSRRVVIPELMEVLFKQIGADGLKVVVEEVP